MTGVTDVETSGFAPVAVLIILSIGYSYQVSTYDNRPVSYPVSALLARNRVCGLKDRLPEENCMVGLLAYNDELP
jgi:hypothetical protein